MRVHITRATPTNPTSQTAPARTTLHRKAADNKFNVFLWEPQQGLFRNEIVSNSVEMVSN